MHFIDDAALPVPAMFIADGDQYILVWNPALIRALPPHGATRLLNDLAARLVEPGRAHLTIVA